jgi:hypothetical protein
MRVQFTDELAWFRLAAALGAVAAVTACGSGGAAGGGAPGEFGLSLEDLTIRVEDTEQFIAQCVAEAGFDYVAVDFVTIKQAMDSDQSAPGLSDDAYLAQYGLGITTQFDKPLVVFGAGPRNNTYLAGLPESDQVAFRRALWGEAVDWKHARALEEEDFSKTGGCIRDAADQLYSAGELSGTYVNPADTLVEQDPRMIDAITAWSDCMAADGYDYTRPDQVTDDLTQRLDAIAQGQDPATLSGPDLDALRELQGEELAVAALLASCEEEHIEPVQEAVEGELYGGSPT